MPHNRKEISQKGIFRRIANLYIDGFRNMTVGRSLWLLVIVKLFIMFAILRTFSALYMITMKTEPTTFVKNY